MTTPLSTTTPLGCGVATSGGELAFDAIGTRWRIDTAVPLQPPVVQQIRDRVDSFDATYSRFRTDSIVSNLARRAGTYGFPADAGPLLALFRELYEASDGAVTPLVGQALGHLGYDADYRLTRRPGVVTVPHWDDVLVVDGTVITTRQPIVLDLGAAGKGYLVDLVAEVLTDAGIDEFVVDASGDLLHRGQTAERVGLENPFDTSQVIGVAILANSALCASASTRRTWGGGLHHIIDPTTAEPVRAVVATWVKHPSCAVADGLATALFLTEPDVLSRHFTFDFVRLLADGRAELSPGFDGALFS